MASTNVSARRAPVFTHEGGRAAHNLTPLAELRRSTLAALLFEDLFYETGSAHAKRVAALVAACKPDDVAALAIECRERMHLRHIPLLLVRELARQSRPGNDALGTLVKTTLARVIQRPDEISEYLSLYWRDRKDGAQRGKPEAISRASLRGLAMAFQKFNRYSLSKYRGDGKRVKLVDALRLCRPTPKDAEQSALWKELRAGTLVSADTWESELSAGNDKRETWTRLLAEKKLGGLAFLRNLRNMAEAGVDRRLVADALKSHQFDRVLPFRFIAAAPFAPGLAAELGDAMERALGKDAADLPGRTIVLVDVSGSMDDPLSAKSDLKRMDAAAGLAILLRARCEDCAVYTFSQHLALVPSYRGIALKDAIVNSQPHGGTYLAGALAVIHKRDTYARIVVITDEQAHDNVGQPNGKGYLINVGTAQYGVGYGSWTTISGFSERVLDFLVETEADTAR